MVRPQRALPGSALMASLWWPTSITFAADIASSRSVNDLSFELGSIREHTMTPWAMLESSQAGRRDVRHDDAVRRSLMVLAGTFVVTGALALPTAASSLPTVRTVAGSGGSRQPQLPDRDRRRCRRRPLRCRHQSLPGDARAEPHRHPLRAPGGGASRVQPGGRWVRWESQLGLPHWRRG